ncbi:MAG TPA: bifunctional diaminohydroxyphosphoribosylaminopyrimidine deaminase/5-amino-6-(5-phosphoribosylamino)uracil reductase RibD, partial [Verrucomicrobiae bacterium]|nr:bifunctional diaminohydroxyphosphoribosylaminopyrimidine deaminase/5-amino-6-(5-phosphoribosylamino)uracil reductase RibD [Verrucomicrobiae bacterium]
MGLARRAVGATAENPAVACVIVRDGVVVGRGVTQPGGRPHAETEALRRAGSAARGATAYVTLEPCAHHGQTPPCAEALVSAGIARVVAAARDPDPRVNGGGFQVLEQAGIKVVTGLFSEDASHLMAGFLARLRSGRPHVTLKCATSLDGRIATANGDSKWITGPDARARAHLMRARSDAILVGIGTVLADDPLLDCRLPGLQLRSPARVVLDSTLRLPADCRLLATAARLRTIILTTAAANPDTVAALEAKGCEVRIIGTDENGRVALDAACATLGKLGFGRVLAEGGGTVSAGLIKGALVDEIAWFRAG